MLKKIVLLLVLIIVIQLSNTPNLYVSKPETWINEPRYEEGISLGYMVSKESPFYTPYREITNADFLLHKLGHVFFYSIITILLYINLKRRSFFKIWLFVTLFAVTDEVHQFFVVGRSGRFFDILFDSIVCVITLLIIKKFNKPKSPF